MSGVKDGDFDRVTIARDLGVGSRADFGTAGQVLKSGGQNRDLTWGSNSATLPEGLTAGDNITFTPSGVYNGSVATTISTTTPPDGGITTLIGGDGIIVEDDSATQKTIKADLKSGSGLVFDGGEIDLESIPNSALANSTISGKALGTNLANLVQGDNITFSTGTTYNGSQQITISSTAPDGGITELVGGDGIIVEDDSAIKKTIKADLKSGSGLKFTSGEIDLDDIPNTALANSTISGKALGTNLSGLTFGTGITATPDIVYDGQTAVTITADTDSTLVLKEGDAISIKETGLDREISVKIDTNTLEFIGSGSKEIAVKKVPQVLTFGTGITATPNQAFDGSTAITITSTDADTTLNLIAGTGISIVSNGLDRTIAFTKLANALITSPSGSSTSDIRIQYAPNTSGGAIGTTFDGSEARRFRVRNTGFAVEILPNTDTTYTMYRRRYSGSLTYPRQTLDTFYPIDTNFYYDALPRISTEASGDYEVDVSFCMGVDQDPSVNELVYVRLDTFVNTSYPNYVTGVCDPQVASMVPTTGLQNTMRFNVKFLVRLGVASASFGFYPAVAQYSNTGTDDTQTNTAKILYGRRFGSLTMTIKPLDHWTGQQTASNPFSLAGDDY